jgi:hypothetical protein
LGPEVSRRLKLGPLAGRYLAFAAGSDYDPLRALSCRRALEVEVSSFCGATRSKCIGKTVLSGPRLGWFTWMKSGPEFDRAPSDTVLLLV